MGSGNFRETMVASKWREIKSRKWRMTTTSKEKAETTTIRETAETMNSPFHTHNKKRYPNLEMLQNLSEGQIVGHSHTTDDCKINEPKQVLRMTPVYDGTLWEHGCISPSRNPSRIANELLAIVCKEIFQVTVFEVVGFALGNNDAQSLGGLLDRICDIRDKFRAALQVSSDLKDIYVRVEKILRLRQPQLAHWVVTSSLSDPQYPLHDALKSIIDPVQLLLATNKLEKYQYQLQKHEQFRYGYHWASWANVPGVWEHTYEEFWKQIQHG